jgi:hypothetical protein
LLKFLNSTVSMVVMRVMRGLTVMTVNCQLSTVIKDFTGRTLLYKNIYIYFYLYQRRSPTRKLLNDSDSHDSWQSEHRNFSFHTEMFIQSKNKPKILHPSSP